MTMTHTDFITWREHMGASKTQVSEWLGISERTLRKYELGDVPVPKVVTLACAALAAGIRRYTPPAPF